MRSYRIHIQLPGKPDVLTTASFSIYGDADNWARSYARSQQKPCKVRIVNHLDRVSACYLGDGAGKVRSASDEIGGAL